MTPLHGLPGAGEVLAWRLDDERFKAAWDSGEGAFQVGGRWNSPGVRAVYCAIDPATAVLDSKLDKFAVARLVDQASRDGDGAGAFDLGIVRFPGVDQHFRPEEGHGRV